MAIQAPSRANGRPRAICGRLCGTLSFVAADSRSGSAMHHRCFAFGEFLLDQERGTVARGDVELMLRPKSFAVLQYLVEHPGRLISKEELFGQFWGDTVVTDGTLAQCLVDIRRALDDRSQSIVRTVHRRGVRFEMAVIELPCAHCDPAEAMSASASPVAVETAPQAAAAATIERPDPPGSDRPRTATTAALVASALLLLADTSPVTAIVPTHGGTSPAEVTGPRSSTGTAVAAMTAVEGQASEVRELVLQGRYLINRRDSGDLDRAEALFREALRLDAGMAEAWAGLSYVHLLQGADPDAPAPPALEAAQRAAERAVSLNPASADAFVNLARALAWRGDADGAMRARIRARELDPEHPVLLGRASEQAAREGRLPEAIDLLRRAIARDPTALVNVANLAHLLAADGRFAEAEAMARRARLLGASSSSPVSRSADAVLVELLILGGRPDEAAGIVATWDPGTHRSRMLAMINASQGELEASAPVLSGLESSEHWESAYWLAKIYTLAGDRDRARGWTETALSRADRSRQPAIVRQARHTVELSAVLRHGRRPRR